MGSIQDMINRVSQNRRLLPSQRNKFKDNREAIHSDQEQDLEEFPERSEFQIRSTIEKVRLTSKKEKRQELLLYLFVFSVGGVLLYWYFT